jgi:hypothetical protein
MCNCQQCRIEIEACGRQTRLTTPAAEHLATCAACRAFQAERACLRRLIDELEPVAAPPDFEFRLCARLSAQERTPVRFAWPALVPRVFGLAFSLCFVVALGVALHRYAQQPTATGLPAGNQSAAVPFGPIASSTTEANNANDIARNTSSKPAANITMNDLPKQPRRVALPERTVADRAMTPRRLAADVASRDLSLRGTPVVLKEPARESVALNSIPLPLPASSRPLKVLLKDQQGVARELSVAPISFGSRDTLSGHAQVMRVSAISEQGVW